LSNADLELSVTDELFWDPKVDSAEIAIGADAGQITLRGTVGSFRQKREAKKAAERVFGVTSVANELEVRILDADRRDDAELRAAILQSMMLDSLIPSTVDAKVDDGYVTLTGEATWQFERDEAEFVAANVLGVFGVENDIELVPPGPSSDEVQGSIKKALERSAKLEANGLSVETSHGIVTLSGSVNSWSEHDAAVDAAWGAPGVTRVDDRIYVEY
jgi:osmotically-inducible protein OsmY